MGLVGHQATPIAVARPSPRVTLQRDYDVASDERDAACGPIDSVDSRLDHETSHGDSVTHAYPGADSITRVANESPAATATPKAAQPERVGRYIVLEILGSGGMGAVYRVYDPKLGREIALKLLRPDLGASDPDAEARIVREAQAMAQLTHPNVLPVYDVEVLDDAVFITMECVDGVTLRTWLKQPRPTHEVLDVFRRAGLGLAAAHAGGLVHRDFKPGNVLVGKDGQVRVMDFGLARSYLDADDSHCSIRRATSLAPISPEITQSISHDVLGTPLTQVGAVVGTPPYMAPEQHDGQAPDAISDQFSFCVSLFEALYGTRPFPSRRIEELEATKKAGKIAELPSKHGVAPWLHSIVIRGLSPDPKARWPSMDALLQALADDPVRRRKRWLAVAAMVLATTGTAAAIAHERDRASHACDNVAAGIEATFDARVSSRLASALQTAGVPEPVWSRLRSDIEHRVASWADERRNACEASRIRHEQSTEMLELRSACLDAHRRQLAALLDALPTVTWPAPALERSATRLGHASECRDRDTLELEYGPHEDRRRREATRDALASAQSLGDIGHLDDALQAVLSAMVSAENEGDHIATARARLLHASLLVRRDDATAAAHEAEEAYFLALRSGHDQLALRAAIVLVELCTGPLDDDATALAWGEHGLALLGRTSHPDAVVGRLLTHLGAAHVRMSNESALSLLERARTVTTAEDVESHAAVRLWLHIAQRSDPIDAADPIVTSVLNEIDQRLGPEHVAAYTLVAELGRLELRRGHLESAIHWLRTAVDGFDRSLGAADPTTVRARTALGRALRQHGQWQAASDTLRHAMTSLEPQRHGDGRTMSRVRYELGETQLRLDDVTTATELLGQAWAHDSAASTMPIDTLAATGFAFARALARDEAQRGRATSLARSAHDKLAHKRGRDAASVREIAAWLAKYDEAASDEPAGDKPR